MAEVEEIWPVIDDKFIWFTNKSKTVDFELSIRQVDENGVKSTVDMRYGSTRQTFVALFDDKDIDFEIAVCNDSSTRMSFDMIFGKKYSYILSVGELSAFDTLEEYGHHLRFLSPNLPTGQSVVDLIANKDSDSRRNAEIMCSRMKFQLGVGKPSVNDIPIVSKVLPQIEAKTDYSDGEVIVFIKTLDQKPMALMIERQMTVNDLKYFINKRTGHPIDDQILIYEGEELEDHRTVAESEIENDSTIHLVRFSDENTAKVVPKLKPSVECMGEVINVFVRTLQSKTIILKIGRLNTLYDLKLLIQEKEGISGDNMRLIRGGKDLDDSKTIDENHIQNDSTLDLTFRLRGGLGGVPGGLNRYSLSKRADPINDNNMLTIPVMNEDVGKRGVIGFGKKSYEKFGETVYDFDWDYTYYIEPFYIEFRLKKQLN